MSIKLKTRLLKSSALSAQVKNNMKPECSTKNFLMNLPSNVTALEQTDFFKQIDNC